MDVSVSSLCIILSDMYISPPICNAPLIGEVVSLSPYPTRIRCATVKFPSVVSAIAPCAFV